MRTTCFVGSLLLAALPVFSDGGGLTPRDGWRFVDGAQDLIAAGSWNCVSSVSASSGSIKVSATDNYNTVINTVGPKLKVDGDFSVLATVSNPASQGTYLTLVGKLNSGAWWNGLKRLDVGIGSNIVVSYWLGDSPNAVSQSFPDLPDRGDPYTLEVARIGTDLVVFVNGVEAGRVVDPGVFSTGQVYLGFNVAPGNTLSVQALAATVPSDNPGNTSVFAPYLHQSARTGMALRDVADAHGFLIGAAVNPSLLSTDAYAETIGREFNVLVAENAMKFDATEPGPGVYNFCAADNLVAFAQTNGIQVRGHNLVWQQALPTWLTKGNYSLDDAVAILQDHITTVMRHFKGKVFAWDVVNEAIAYGAPYGPQPSFWRDTIGPQYVDLAFQWARAADPDVKLIYNDTGGEGLGAKSDAVYALVKGMLDRGIPVDGVGLQMHVDLAGAPSADAISRNIQRYAQLGLDVHITEMDVRLKLPVTADALNAQAAVYQRVLTACQANSNCKALLTWGVSDASSWIPGFYPGFGSALLFDEMFQPKPAYQALWNTLAGQ